VSPENAFLSFTLVGVLESKIRKTMEAGESSRGASWYLCFPKRSKCISNLVTPS
jgi:hypothetical protein